MERVYVGNLPPDIRIKDIDDFFRPFGKLIYIDVNHRANPVYAYVQFDSARNAFNAVKARHGYDYEGYALQMRLVENEVRKRRDASPPPPPPPMYSDYGNRMGGNYTNSSMSSFQSSSNSQWSNNNNRSNMQQQNIVPYSSGGRSNNSNRSNISQHNNSNRSNMQQQQQYYNTNRSSMSQDNMMNYSNRNNVNMPQPNAMNYSNNSNGYNMSQQQDMNMMNYSNNNNWVIGNNGNNGSWNNGGNNNSWNGGNNSWNGGNNNSWNGGNNISWNGGNDVNNSWNNVNNNMGNMDWNNGNNAGINNFNNVPPYVYNPNNDPYAKPGFEDSYTRGLSGSGRKWFNRYIRKGFSPEMARAKALEHRTVPYLRDDPKPPMADPTNVALETIGNTIISLLSTANPVDNYNNNNNQMMPAFSNWGGDNFQAGFDMTGPSTSNVNRDGDRRNRITSKSHIKSLANHLYNKSMDILDKITKNKAIKSLSPSEKLVEHFHMQIIKEYEEFYMKTKTTDINSVENIQASEVVQTPQELIEVTTSTNPQTLGEKKALIVNTFLNTTKENVNVISPANHVKTSEELLKEFNDLKLKLYKQVKPNPKSPERKLSLEAKNRKKLLMEQGGLREKEAKALAILSSKIIQKLLDIKKAYDIKREKEKIEHSTVNKIKHVSSVSTQKPKTKPLQITINVNTKAMVSTNTQYSVNKPTSLDLLKDYQYYKSALLLKAKQNSQQYKIKLSHEDEKRQQILMLQAGLEENEAKMLATVTHYSLQKLIDLKQQYEIKKISENSFKYKTSEDLWQEFLTKKQELLKLAIPDPKEKEKKLSKEAKRTRKMLMLEVGFLKEHEATLLAVLELNKLQKLIDLKKLYTLKKKQELTVCGPKITQAKTKEIQNIKQNNDKINAKSSPDLIEVQNNNLEIIDLTNDYVIDENNYNKKKLTENNLLTSVEEENMNMIIDEDENNNTKEINTELRQSNETEMDIDTDTDELNCL